MSLFDHNRETLVGQNVTTSILQAQAFKAHFEDLWLEFCRASVAEKLQGWGEYQTKHRQDHEPYPDDWVLIQRPLIDSM
ncbi:hypothetical protein [Agrobacterium tumefaciens]|uniref:hypothetical protein n=1 Tax=Agrobacterium tumefaciens TaxID=358 RepID=UPI00287CC4F9|nr:hypothetical protein [Agrobacterium tumefaciens]MDS7593961.1 hypothetical protein [Agrobacterium tumefaciens]